MNELSLEQLEQQEIKFWLDQGCTVEQLLIVFSDGEWLKSQGYHDQLFVEEIYSLLQNEYRQLKGEQ